MEIGVRLRQARLEMGLSQRELCGELITRNMLSLIENGSARPSMDTLIYLAGRLNRPVAYFLGEETLSGNALCMAKARECYARGALSEAENALTEYEAPDSALDEEWNLLRVLVLLRQAEENLDRPGYALDLLNRAAEYKGIYITEEIQRRRLLLLAQVSREPVALPAEDLMLILRAKNALQEKDFQLCRMLLQVCQNQASAQWNYLMAEAAFGLGDYALAAEHYPADCYKELEACYRNLGDFKLAYEYACKQRIYSSNLPNERI